MWAVKQSWYLFARRSHKELGNSEMSGVSLVSFRDIIFFIQSYFETFQSEISLKRPVFDAGGHAKFDAGGPAIDAVCTSLPCSPHTPCSHAVCSPLLIPPQITI